jgi:hypothetical protein
MVTKFVLVLIGLIATSLCMSFATELLNQESDAAVGFGLTLVAAVAVGWFSAGVHVYETYIKERIKRDDSDDHSDTIH